MQDMERTPRQGLGKTLLIIALLAVVLAEAAYIFLARGPSPAPEPAEEPLQQIEPVQVEPEQVSLITVTVEPELRRWLRIAFDKPLGEELVGVTLDEAPATVSPERAGTWTWISPHLLQFDPEEPFYMGTDYEVRIIPERILGPGMAFTGDTTATVSTGVFEVRSLDLYEDPSSEGPGMVVVKGEIEFSYSVEPEELADRLHVFDPLSGQEIPVALTTSYRSRWIGFRTDPVQKQVERRDLRISIDSSLGSAYSLTTLGQEYVQHYPLEMNAFMSVVSVSPESSQERTSIRIRFSTPVTAEALEQNLGLNPSVETTITMSGTNAYLTGDFQPGTEYTLTLPQGMYAADGAALQYGYSEIVYIPDLDPFISFEDPGMFLSRQGLQNIALKYVNVDHINFSVDRVYPNNLFTMLTYYSEWMLFQDETWSTYIDYRLGDSIVEEELAVDAPPNQVGSSVVNVGQYIPEGEHGIYRIHLARPDYEWEQTQRWVLITDLGLVAKQGEDSFLVWVSSFDDLSPKAGVTVRVISEQNQLIAEGVTNDEGLFMAAGLGEIMDEHQPYLITAELGDDFSFLLMGNFRIDTTGQDVGGIFLESDDYYAYLYGERDIYRPGETAKGLAVIRDAGLQTPPSMPLRLRQTDPQGQEVSTQVLTSNEQGLAEFSIDIPDYAPTGDYTLELMVAEEVIGTYRFKVEEFVPDRIKVEIAPEKASIASDEPLNFEVASRYFFGPPASDMRVEARVRLVSAPFAPSGYEGFVFGNSERSFEDQDIFEDEDVLDSEGLHAYTVDLPEGLTPPAALEAVITTRVMERGGRGVAAMQRVTAHAYPYYPGLKKLSKWGFDLGEEIDFDWVLVTPDGQAASPQSLTMEVYKDRWQTVLRRTPSGGYRYDSIRDSWLQHTKTLDAASDGSFSFIPPEFGSYRVVLTDPETGASCQMSFYVGGWGYSPWAVSNPGSIDLVPDREEYMDGDQAHIQVRAPFSGRLLVTVEGQSVLHHQIVDMEGNTADVVIPVDGDWSPNVYVSAVLVRSASDVEPGSAARASGCVPLYVDRTANKPDIRIFTPEQIRPETQLEVRLQVEPGAVVTLAAVDEGILQLISQETPDPFSFFYAKRSLGVAGFDIFAWLFPEVPSEGRSPAGGDAALDRSRQFVRTESIRRVKPVAFWSGPLTADENGEIVYTLDVPDFQGALRLMAVAVNGRRFNSADAMTRVRTPVIVTPTFPRFLSLEETLQIPVTVRNDTDRDGQFTVTMETTGPVSLTASEMQLFVPQGAERLTYFTMNTGASEGAVTCTVRAQGNGEDVQTEVDLYSRAAFPFQAVVEEGNMQEFSALFEFPGSDVFHPEAARREIRIARTPLVRFSRSLGTLLRYPYGCVEQTTSRVFPLLYIEDLAAELEPELFEHSSPTYMVQDGIRRLRAMQTQEGGFGMWMGDRRAYPYGTLYATHFLLEARESGYNVGDTMVESALDYIEQNMIPSQDAYTDYELNQVCYALYVLTKGGRTGHIGLMNSLRANRLQRLRSGPGPILGAAYGLMGDFDAMNELSSGTWMREEVRRLYGYSLDSTLRNLALRLSVLLDVAEGDDATVAEAVELLVSRMEQERYYSTQEASFCFMALGKYFRRQIERGPYAGSVYLGDQVLGDFSSDAAFVRINVEGTEPLRIEMHGEYPAGAAYYSVITRGVPTRQAYEPQRNGIDVRRRLLDREGNPLDLTQVRQGDIVVMETSVRSLQGEIENVAVQALLPTGLEVENPRLDTTETLPWIQSDLYEPAYQDLRDDRVLLFLDLDGNVDRPDRNQWQTYYSLLRAVTPGFFTLPPIQAEAMYDPELVCSTQAVTITVIADSPGDPAEAPAGQGDAPGLTAPEENAPQDMAPPDTTPPDGQEPDTDKDMPVTTQQMEFRNEAADM